MISDMILSPLSEYTVRYMMDLRTGERTTLQTKCVDRLLNTILAYKKVKMNRDIYIGKHLAQYIQNRDQTTITEM